jgi:hypothetical protein
MLLIISIPVIAQEDMPSWVNRDAYNFANYYWYSTLAAQKDEWIEKRYGSDNINSINSAKLSNPYKIVLVDYENYASGDNIYDRISFKDDRVSSAFGFGVYLKDVHIGVLEVYYNLHNEKWKLLQIRSCGGECNIDMLGDIYSKYPFSVGYELYQQLDSLIFFVCKNDQIVAVYSLNESDGEMQKLDPAQHMLLYMKKMKEWESSPMIKRYKEKMNIRNKSDNEKDINNNGN